MAREPSAAVAAVEEGLVRSWAALGFPLSVDLLTERKEGLIDPEVLVVLTLSLRRDPRLLKDVATVDDPDIWVVFPAGAIPDGTAGHVVTAYSDGKLASSKMPESPVQILSVEAHGMDTYPLQPKVRRFGRKAIVRQLAWSWQPDAVIREILWSN